MRTVFKVLLHLEHWFKYFTMNGFWKLLLIVVSVAIINGCKRYSPGDCMSFENVFYVNDFSREFNLENGEKLELGHIMGAQSLYVRDSLLIVSTLESDGFWSFYHLPELSYLGSYLAKGRAGNEVMASPRVAWQSFSESDGELYAVIYDFYKGSLLKMNITETLRDDNLSIQNIECGLPRVLFSVLQLDSVSYFCREVNGNQTEQTRYIWDSNKREKAVPKNMSVLNKASVDAGSDVNILGCYYCYNRERNIMVEAAMDLSHINLYSVGDGVVNMTISPEDELDRISDIQVTEPRKKKTAYCGLVGYKDFFIALYQGDTAENIHYGKARKQTLQIFDWEGTPLACVELDKPVNSFDIDFAQRKLYTLNYETEDMYVYEFDDVLEILTDTRPGH